MCHISATFMTWLELQLIMKVERFWMKFIFGKVWLISASLSSNTSSENKNVIKSKSTRWWVATQVKSSMLQIIVTQQCHVAIHNFYLRTALQWGLCVSMSILISKLPLPCSLGLQSSYFLQSSIREETRIVRFLFLWEMGLLGSQSSSKENILLLRTFFFEFSCTWKCKRKAFVKFMFSKKRTKFDKIFTVHLTLCSKW